MEKGDILTIEIIDMTEEGAGVGRTDSKKDCAPGLAVFVDGGAVPGDTVSCEITKIKKNYAFANLKEIVKKSSHRREDVCQYLNNCGGCAFGMLNYESQLELKVGQLKNKLARIAGVEQPVINPPIAYEPYLKHGGEDSCELNYRNKAVMAVGEDEEGNPLIGFRAAKSHRIVDCNNCKIQKPTVMVLAEALRKFMHEYGVNAYNHEDENGIIKSLMVRTAYLSKEVMAVIEINGEKIPYEEELAYMFDESIEELDGEYSLESIIVRSSRTYVLAGKKTIRDELMGLEFDVSAESFYQVNSRQTVKLYEEVIRMLVPKEDEKIIDAYCGIGTIGLIAASRSKATFIGIESVPQAVRDANKNAIRNGIVNEIFIEGKAEELLPRLLDSEECANIDVSGDVCSGVRNPDAIILDPPRAGCDKILIDAIIKTKPSRIVYVSCDQGTMARDVKLLIEGGYELIETTPCDMFPDTGRLESVSLLKNIK